MAPGGDKRSEPQSAAGDADAEKRASLRGPLVIPLRCLFDSVLDFVDTQSRNISLTGMFLETLRPAPVGSQIDFEFDLAGGFTLLKGQARVVRVVTAGPVTGMGVEFVALDEPMRRLVDRIVEVNAEEGRHSTLNFDFSRPALLPPRPVSPTTTASLPTIPATRAAHDATSQPAVVFTDSDLRVVLSAETIPYFTANPLLNIRLGGFFVPARSNPALGAVFAVTIVDQRGDVIVAGKGKVVAKQDVRVGIRLADTDKEGLGKLRSEVAKLTAGK